MTSSARLASIGLASVLLAFAGCAGNTDARGTPAAGGSVAMVTAQDAAFVAQAVPAGLAEVELGRLAVRRANHAQVRAFAQRMIDAHSETNERLLAFAQHYQIDAPQRLEGDGQEAKEVLSGLHGEAFDRAYMQRELRHQQSVLDAYRRQAEQGNAAALQALAQTFTPTLEQHLRAAQSIARSLPSP